MKESSKSIAYKFLIVLFTVVLGACNTSNKEPLSIVERGGTFDYEVTRFEFIGFENDEYEGSPVQFGQVYNNKMHIVELKENDNGPLSSKRLFTYDLDSHEKEEIPAIEKQDDTNRIIDFLVLGDNHYVYSEVCYNKVNNNQDYDYIEVYNQVNDTKTLLASGAIYSILAAPMFKIFNDKIYYSINTFEFDSNGVQTLSFNLIDGASQKTLYTSSGKIAEFKSNPETESRIGRPFLADGIISVIISKGNEHFVVSVDEDDVTKKLISQNDLFANILSVDDVLIATHFTDKYGGDKFASSLLDAEGNSIDLPRQHYYSYGFVHLNGKTVSLGRNTYVNIIDFENNELISAEIPYVDGSYFRQINDYQTLIFGGDKCYLLEMK